MKAGKPFEEAVAEILRAIDPKAKVKHGQWIEGPDGRRDLDVYIEGSTNGTPYKTLVECKDYDRKRTGPVGIDIVDALDSKRRDLKFDLAIICSNAGFTKPAARKAKRVGIVLIGVFRQGDGRIRHELIDYVYFRRLKIIFLGFRLDFARDQIKRSCCDVGVKLGGMPVANWVCHNAIQLIMRNPVAAGHYAGSHEFILPLQFDLPDGGTFIATHLFSEFKLTGGWFEQSAVIDGTEGVYDFLRRRVRVGSEPYQLHFKHMDVTKGTPVEYPPRPEIDISPDQKDVWFQLLYLENANCHEPVPPLHDLMVGGVPDMKIKGLPTELQRTEDSANPSQHYLVCKNPKVGPDHSFTISFPGKKPT